MRQLRKILFVDKLKFQATPKKNSFLEHFKGAKLNKINMYGVWGNIEKISHFNLIISKTYKKKSYLINY